MYKVGIRVYLGSGKTFERAVDVVSSQREGVERVKALAAGGATSNGFNPLDYFSDYFDMALNEHNTYFYVEGWYMDGRTGPMPYKIYQRSAGAGVGAHNVLSW